MMSGSRAWLSVLAVILAIGSEVTGVWAQASETSTQAIAMIDVQRVLRESVAARGIQRQIEAQRETYHLTLQKQEVELRAADAELNDERTNLTEEEYRLKRSELEESVAAVRRELQERKRALDRSMVSGMAQVRDKLVEVVAEIAEERGITLVVLKSAIFLGATDLEISDEALQRLNERLPAVVPLAAEE